MPTNKKDYMRNYLRNYRKTHPEYIQRAKERCKERAKERRTQNPKLQHNNDNLRHEKLRQKLLLIIGHKCLICGSTNNLIFHELHGKEHDTSNLWATLKHPQDFIPLCFYCHKLVHFLATVHSDEELERAVILSARITNSV